MKLAAIVLVSTALWAGVASAAPADRDVSAADALFRAGRRALAEGNLAVACTRFAESYRLDPAAGTLLNLADCEEQSGRLSLAMTHFTEVRDALVPGDFRVPTVAKRIASLDKRVPRLTLLGSSTEPVPHDARLECDGVELGPGALGVPLPVDPGPHACILHVVNRSESRIEVVLKEGERLAVAIQPGAPRAPDTPTSQAPAAAPHRDSPAASTTPPRRAATASRTPVYVLGSIGVAGMIVGTITGVVALRAGDEYRAHCTPNCDEAGVDAASRGRTMVIASPVAFGIGIAGLGAAAIVFAVGDRAKPATTVRITPAGAFVASSF